MTRVAIVECPDYDLDRVRAAVRRAMALAPDSAGVFERGRRVLLKPNLLSSTHTPEQAVNTHPAVVQALAEFAVERGCEVFVGDSCGCLGGDSTSRAIEITRLHEVARATGCRLVNLDKAEAVSYTPRTAGRLRSFRVPRLVFEVDALVSVPKFKTHGLTLLTGAVKNLLGLIPGKGKKDVHLAAAKPSTMAKALVDIFEAFPPRFAVMDAVVGMQGEGPAGGEPRQVGFLLASSDAVALDAVAEAMMGFGPAAVLTTVLAAQRGLGVADLDRIEVVGAPLEQARVLDWKPPPGWSVRRAFWRVMPAPLASGAFALVGDVHAAVNPELCRGCGLCVSNCPAGALTQTPDGVKTEPRRCIACYCCAEVCPHRAIEMRQSRMGRLIRSVARLVRGRRNRP